MSNKSVCFIFALLVLVATAQVTEVYAADPPSPWSSQDIGDVGAVGSCDFNNGTFTVDGSGIYIWASSDEFHFVYHPLAGDGYILARVVSIENTNMLAKGGVMIRESLDPNSAHAMISIFPTIGSAFLYRPTTEGSTSQTISSGVSAPYWVKVVRSGDTLSGYISPDGSSWTQVGSPQAISMGRDIYMGLAVTSYDDGVLCTVDFNNVEVSSPVPLPNYASEPTPVDDAENMPTDVVLSWTLGEYAADVNGHHVYFGTDFNDVNDGLAATDKGLCTDSSYTPDTLECGRTYHWRVDEVNDPCLWQGEVWSFMVRCDRAIVGFIDSGELLSSISEQWLNDECRQSVNPLQASWCCGADADHSGSVDFGDYASLAKDGLQIGRLGDLQIPPERIPEWNPGVEGGIPDTNAWPIFCDATHSPYNADGNDGISDVTAINTAINAAASVGGNQVVYLPAGTFRFDDGQTIYIKSNVILRGAGMNQTTITGYRADNSGAIQFNGSQGTFFTITDALLPRGTTAITVNNPSALSVGQYAYIYQNNDLSYILPGYDFIKAMNHIFKVVAKEGSVITMDRPLRHVFNTSLDPRGYGMNTVSNAGLEDMKVMHDENSDPALKGPMVDWDYAVNTWAKNVYFYNGYRKHIQLTKSANNTIEHCLFERMLYHVYTPSNHFDAYGIVLFEGSADNLITNSAFRELRMPISLQRGCNGNVFSYNYLHNNSESYWSRGIFFHGFYPHSNLLEGNAANGTIGAGDNWWGRQGPRNTIFRNRFTGSGFVHTEEIVNPAHSSPSHFIMDQFNMIGNIAYGIYSKPGCNYETGGCHDFDRETTNMWAERNITRDDRPDSGSLSWGFIEETPEPSSVFIENVDGDKAPAGWSTFDMPASLYLTGPPDFWPGGKPWPCIGSDVDDFTGTLTKLPAQQWYEAM